MVMSSLVTTDLSVAHISVGTVHLPDADNRPCVFKEKLLKRGITRSQLLASRSKRLQKDDLKHNGSEFKILGSV